MSFIEDLVGWDFLDEPLYRWFLFLGALAAMTIAWTGIIDFMK